MVSELRLQLEERGREREAMEAKYEAQVLLQLTPTPSLPSLTALGSTVDGNGEETPGRGGIVGRRACAAYRRE